MESMLKDFVVPLSTTRPEYAADAGLSHPNEE